MNTTFYDQTGAAIAYTENDGTLYLFTGEPVAYIENEAIYLFSGKHAGWFEDGWIRDKNGNCVFYTDTATGGPIKPVKHISPVKSVKHIKPVKSVKNIKSIKSVKSLSWSSLSNTDFFS